MTDTLLAELTQPAPKPRQIKSSGTFEDKFREEIEDVVQTVLAVTGIEVTPEDTARKLAVNPDVLVSFVASGNAKTKTTADVLDLFRIDPSDYDLDVAPETQDVSLGRFIEKFTPEVVRAVLILKINQQHEAGFENVALFLHGNRSALADVISLASLEGKDGVSRKEEDRAGKVVGKLVTAFRKFPKNANDDAAVRRLMFSVA